MTLGASKYSALSVADIQKGLAARDFSAYEVATAAIDAIAALDHEIHAFLEPTQELAIDAAKKVDDQLASGTTVKQIGSLAGVPIGFKDNMNVKGTHTTCASKMLANYISPFTATCATKALQAGALPLGKLNMDEFAFGSSTETSAFGCTHNPWDLTRVPGGSSGGSAAAVASGMVTVSLGSDTGGSIRQPAALCSVVGMKPSYGAISRFGVVAFGSSLDQVGPLGRSVADVAQTLDAIVGLDTQDSTSQPIEPKFGASLNRGIKGKKIGVVKSFLDFDGIAPEISLALNVAIKNLESLGACVVEAELPNARAALNAYYAIGPCEAFSNLSRFDSIRYGYCEPGATNLAEQYELSRTNGFGAEVVRRIMLGSYLLSSGVYDTYYYPAQQIRTLITQDFARAFEQVDALITPTTPRSAFKFGEITDPNAMYLSDIFTVPVNIAGNAALSLPVGLGLDSNLPVSVQIISAQFKDEDCISVAAALESCYDFERLAPIARKLETGSEGGAK